jgi:MOSC domain-containing protein YiiM
MTAPPAHVVAVHRDEHHRFSKVSVDAVTLRTGLGVEGDAHFGVTVQHLSRVARDPSAPNLRQVHLLHDELLAALVADGFAVFPGAIGENVTTHGLDLLALPAGTTLRLGADAVVELTGLRNPCRQLDRYQSGLQRAVLDRDAAGNLIRRSGVMAVVRRDGIVRPGDVVEAVLPLEPYQPLEPV